MLRQKKLCKFNTNKAATIIPIGALLVAATAVAGTVLYLSVPEKTMSSAIDVPDVQVKTSGKEDTPDYTLETNYKGHLSQFPELYEIPFKKSDSYVCNKEFSRAHYNVLNEYENDATAFIETLFNVDYRTVAANQTGFVSDVMQNGDYETLITRNFGTEDEKTMYLYDYIEDISSYFIENQVEMESKFYTDDSLVYSDFYTFVRGELVFTIYSSEDPSSEYKVGEEYQVPIEVAMQRSPSNSFNRTVCSFGKAGDNTFFLTP
ncbi:hypothetical protein [Butyrivibrio sp. AC2005]|uniref:hypothetical protein n=1 Tax=Butyrivibrio sp. AC2005 TaxID=1280672 RepID=UPI00047D6F1B|nr:hypothetical protein [Butyrivibrio sp. AC2005]